MLIGSHSLVSPDFDVADDVRIGNNVCLEGRGRIGSGVTIGHGVVMAGDFSIGAGTRIGHHCVLSGPVEIGCDNTIHSFCSIGDAPQHPELPTASGGVRIGDGNVVREYCTIHAPTVETATVIGSRCYLMVYSHVAHDCVVGDDVKFANNATLAGHVVVDRFAYLALHCIIHQRLRIGAHCMIGMNAIITKNAPPAAVIFGDRFRKINRHGLAKRGISAAEADRIEGWYSGRVDHGAASPLIAEIERFHTECGAAPVYRLMEN